MTTRLCLVRHGETAWNAEHRVQGQLDVPLNGTGLAQAQAIARALSREHFDALYASDLSRALQTAQPLAGLLKRPIVQDRDLRERHYGIFQKLTYAEVKVRFPEDYARFEARDPDFAFRTGESLREFSKRSVDVILKIARENEGKSVAVFTHGGVLDMFYRFIKGLPLQAARDFGIPNCGINRLALEGDRWSMQCWAEVAHLEAALDDFDP
ncbi:MAG TPA: histidine phosphatase family protein [Burkholderiales bacterium]|jgi:probable phosphoglycerate mutase|nr:histidine phosphatase family protein [Burkholderiales bacterium]HEX2648311.1 histidine phosphatase family protein [Burkholderiales bacterium]